MSLRPRDIALVVSILMNVFLIGAAVTIYIVHEKGDPISGGRRSSMRAAAMSLDEAHRTAFARMLRSQGKAIQAETRSAKAIRDDAWASLAADNFDPADAKQKLARARELNVTAHRAIEDAVVDFAVGLTPAQRASFINAVRRAASHQHADFAKGHPRAR